MYAENERAMKSNEAALNDLPGELYTIEANDKVPDICKYPLALIQAAQNQNEANARGLAKLLQLKTGARVMLTVNMDIQDHVINGHTGIIRHIEFAQGYISNVYVKHFDEQVGSKVKR